MTEEKTIPIKYVGIRPEYTDGCYGTKVTWQKDEVLNIPADVAVKMLRHPDVWVDGSDKTAKPEKVKKEKVKTPKIEKRNQEGDELDEEIENQAAKSNLQNMDAEAVRRYIHDNFAGHKISKTITKAETLREKAIILIDQFGLPK